MNQQLTQADLDRQAREAAADCLALCVHYCEMTVAHLQIADDPGAIWDLTHAVDAMRRAVRAYSPIREAMKQGGHTPEPEASE
ncbi:hypothetical protein M2323_001980 [Rhodoblastus acidophilus]|uniref:hypothetical protein n=1 Tax=Rhodoblastus acidophilus TaxID=1074 RepID=UPI002224D0CD|nr:hypothetical protein [Rhodoblastus acidophilus]MCW2285686.1 hypothetical protein [Rhodoblastus acidophilus]MCW2333058.1 hypothetical protein [Rhodoblastus acidophilus]